MNWLYAVDFFKTEWEAESDEPALEEKTLSLGLIFWSMLLGNEDVSVFCEDFLSNGCHILKESFLVESVIKAKLIDWEESLPT